MMEKFKWLAAVIAAHPGQKVVGRTRLQKTVKLLQSLGAPMDYAYMIHFYGPYSEGVQSDIGLLEAFGFVQEDEHNPKDGPQYFVLRANKPATELADRAEVKPFQNAITIISRADPVVLELAATYDAFRACGQDHETALARLRRKKGVKCEGDRTEKALALLRQLGLPDGRRSAPRRQTGRSARKTETRS